MLIRSKFKDYYDGLGGIDKSIVYIRDKTHYLFRNNTVYKSNYENNKDIPLEPNSNVYKAFLKLRDINKSITDSHRVLYGLWRGKLGRYSFRRGLRLSVVVVGNKIIPTIEFDNKYIYTYDKLIEEVTKLEINKDLDLTKSKWLAFVKDCENIKFVDIQILLNSPIFKFRFEYNPLNISRFNLTKDVCLKDIGLITVLDPYQVSQEISMFISGVLRQPEKEMVQITDEKMLLKKHGMGSMSFKQGSPGLKKERRRQNKLRKRKGNSV